ncbi:MAG: hypothetical protein GXY83_37275 [Rhodopirellula sp.]|nr:hypothetical protein [Rhodopirellula sp.]
MATTEYLDRMLDPFTDCLTPDAARRVAAWCVDPQMDARIDELADKCTEGELTPEVTVHGAEERGTGPCFRLTSLTPKYSNWPKNGPVPGRPVNGYRPRNAMSTKPTCVSGR